MDVVIPTAGKVAKTEPTQTSRNFVLKQKDGLRNQYNIAPGI